MCIRDSGSTALTATVSPSNADQTVTWTSSDEAVATVAQDGTVTAVAAGEAIITASAGAYRASCTVTVTGADVDVLPSTEPTETEDQLPDGLNDEVKEAVNLSLIHIWRPSRKRLPAWACTM